MTPRPAHQQQDPAREIGAAVPHGPGGLSTARAAKADPNQPERIRMARARGITGLTERRMQQKSERGEIPGAIKIDGLWTYDEAELRAWLKKLEQQQCAERKTAAGASPKRPGTPNGVVTSSTGASGSRAPSGAGRYERGMSALLALGSKRTLSG